MPCNDLNYNDSDVVGSAEYNFKHNPSKFMKDNFKEMREEIGKLSDMICELTHLNKKEELPPHIWAWVAEHRLSDKKKISILFEKVEDSISVFSSKLKSFKNFNFQEGNPPVPELKNFIKEIQTILDDIESIRAPSEV